MELETMKFIVKQSIVTKNLCRFADDQIATNKNIVRAFKQQRKSILCLCMATALLLLAENNSQKRIQKLENEVSQLKNKIQDPEPDYFNDSQEDPTTDCFDVKLP